MKFKEWLKDLTYEVLQGSLDVEVEEVIYDSRKARNGAVFVCMKGTRTDSHEFIPEVVNAGVQILVVERKTELPDGVTAILVHNAREALALLSAARFGYPAEKMVTIGVTGTKGKTTTTHMIKTVLEACGKKVGMIGTTGIVIGQEVTPTVNTTPESYELHQAFCHMAEAGCEYMVMEVSSQAFKMHRVDGISFDYGLFTNISPDHIGPDEHADFEEYLYYKSRIFSCCKVGIMNGDDEHWAEVVKDATCRLYSFSMEKKSTDFKAEAIRYIAQPDFVGLEFDIKGISQLSVRVNIPGRFNVANALAAVSVLSFLGLPKENICHGLEHLNVNGRMEIVYSSETCTVIVDYAHNAVSMESLLSTLRDYRPKRLVCVFGCGGNRSKDRRITMGDSAGRLADFTIITADNSRYEKTEDIIADIRKSLEKTGGKFIEIPDRREAIRYSITHAQPGDMIAIIGKGHENYQEMNGVRYHFSDQEEILKAVDAQLSKEA
ncbi:UDP-N-acetylmuramoyl-L-alanyl-D-glutamate--2,6-diaminopimelate ligase [Lacrimispora saccharolytica]|uniref:UDP-N-acetylmuramyl-tripeptide synthetase n=1 Tax=Lacrimispora saccharolytica (strain ATCC 35040 / DSM 2544 / NRCC 2533 / WM1) TaxID=610130 RepID=D9R258_LACSW|nr:UDP-N-acetylmuramoyl-L-alanyl-D-glutamate--2,6-diaminopimelate ligase [Lacrimispora saccharolytica]ADL04708.1 UDP-N-acetylmuramyl-tripeptide synthetase [[Clostridium] saccharolyticum WM1]QRV21066.1 UDP-N-acetylmuramoyl-L-alanyl-D-glutamate--2,6-diaminopimelate ligase [Lacrimispora saccharolytica]